MKFTRLYSLFALSLCFFAFSCKETSKTAAESGIPDSVRDIIKNAPEDVLLGIGIAQTESDGESILLAENRAREEIARQISTYVQNTISDNENLTFSRATAAISSRVIRREKDKNGNWWCVVITKNEVKPREDELLNIIRSNMAENFEATDITTVKEIPEWVIDSYKYLPEDVLCGVGAARLANDEDSILLAKERARRSLAHSLSTNVSNIIADYYISGTDNSYEEYNSSNDSLYNHTFIQTQLLNMEKTKDGTWWLMLGCETVSTDTTLSTYIDAEARMNQAFERQSMGITD